ncbi:carbohydrate kinase family protein [Paenarthrobacter nitroguajacolicus]|uniref:carbohydrate kinase family protein n=1 Tax=Paenarthrobacter nitroguajacolicus TaxID=211146 RepID=UPI003D1C2258
MSAPPSVAVCGAASWNQLILLDHLPEPVPHMQFARRSWHTIGGTSAGKALHLASLGVNVRLCSPLGTDAEGQRIRSALTAAGIDVEPLASEQTERHLNLMSDDGKRVSLYLAVPSTPTEHELSIAAEAVAAADVAVERGPRLAVCTRGAEGAIALEASGARHEVSALPADVVDTNGAGDAFMTGFLAATLRGATIDGALTAGAAQARTAVESDHLHPKLSELLI